VACDEGTFAISGELALFNIERGCRVFGNATRGEQAAPVRPSDPAVDV